MCPCSLVYLLNFAVNWEKFKNTYAKRFGLFFCESLASIALMWISGYTRFAASVRAERASEAAADVAGLAAARTGPGAAVTQLITSGAQSRLKKQR